LATIKTAGIITIYRQKLFLPVNVDSRWFIVKNNVFRIQSLPVLDNL
jgi:hypothetical protein